MAKTGRFLVSACGGSERFTHFKKAAKYARSMSVASRNGCGGANLWDVHDGIDGRERGSMLLRCKNKVCVPTANLLARQQDMMRGRR